MLWNVRADLTWIYPWILSGYVRMSSDLHDMDLFEFQFFDFTFVTKTNM